MKLRNYKGWILFYKLFHLMKYYIAVNAVSLNYFDSKGGNLQKNILVEGKLDDSVGKDIYKQT